MITLNWTVRRVFVHLVVFEIEPIDAFALIPLIRTGDAVAVMPSLKTPAGIPARATDPGILEETAPRPRS